LKLLLTLPVSSDKDVTAAEMSSSNLVLFGTKETNQLIERFAGKFPLELNPGAADYGLMFVVPVGEKYAAVNSGLPFWTGSEGAKRPGLGFIESRSELLDSFGDYILFKGSLANVVAEGRFDRNWKLLPGVSAKMSETGTVSIR